MVMKISFSPLKNKFIITACAIALSLTVVVTITLKINDVISVNKTENHFHTNNSDEIQSIIDKGIEKARNLDIENYFQQQVENNPTFKKFLLMIYSQDPSKIKKNYTSEAFWRDLDLHLKKYKQLESDYEYMKLSLKKADSQSNSIETLFKDINTAKNNFAPLAIIDKISQFEDKNKDLQQHAQIMLIKAHAYELSSNYQDAKKYYAKAYILNPEAPNIANAYAVMLKQEGKYKEAKRIYENILVQLNKQRDESSARFKSIIQGNLSVLNIELKDYQNASNAILKSFINKKNPEFIALNPKTGFVIDAHKNNLEEAIIAYCAMMETPDYKNLLPDLNFLKNLNIYADLQDPTLALKIYNCVINSLENKQLPKEYKRLYAIILDNLAMTYRKLGNIQQANITLLKSRKLIKQISNKDSLDYCIHQYNYALLLVDERKLDEAKSLLEKNLTTLKKVYGAKNSTYIRSLKELAYINFHQNKIDLALSQHKILEEIILSSYGKNHEIYISNLMQWGYILLSIEHHQSAKAKYTEALELIEKTYHRKNERYIQALSQLALIDFNTGHQDTARLKLGNAYMLARKNLGENHPITKEMQFNIVEVDKWKKSQKARTNLTYQFK
jgi:tetratricopeptide (TPR) repeat protein